MRAKFRTDCPKCGRITQSYEHTYKYVIQFVCVNDSEIIDACPSLWNVKTSDFKQVSAGIWAYFSPVRQELNRKRRELIAQGRGREA